jgi:predicted transcriptional regulator
VQVSLDRELLERIDRDAEVRRNGRSAFIRTAVERQLAFEERRQVEAQLAAVKRNPGSARWPNSWITSRGRTSESR